MVTSLPKPLAAGTVPIPLAAGHIITAMCTNWLVHIRIGRHVTTYVDADTENKSKKTCGQVWEWISFPVDDGMLDPPMPPHH